MNATRAGQLNAEQVQRLSNLWNISKDDDPHILIHRGLEHLKLSTKSETGSAYFVLAQYCHQWKNMLPGIF